MLGVVLKIGKRMEVVGLIQLFECLRIERRGHHAFSCDAVRRRPLTDYLSPH